MRGRVLAGLFGGAVMATVLFAGAAGAEDPLSGAPQPGARGMALINCKVSDDRSLTDCRLIKESPPGAGFGAMALRMANLLRLSPQSTVDESGRITLPMLFKPSASGGADTAPDDSASPAPAAPEDGDSSPASDDNAPTTIQAMNGSAAPAVIADGPALARRA